MIRVLQVTGGLNTGGLETVAMNVARYADPSRVTFDFLVYGDQVGAYEKEAEERGFRVIHISGGGNRVRQYIRIRDTLKKYGPYDVVYSHSFFNSGIVVRAAKKAGVKKCIAHAHQAERPVDRRFDRRIFYALMRRWLNRYADIRLACSSAAGRHVFGKDSSFTVVLNGIDIDRFRYSETGRRKIRKELGLAGDEFVLGNIGRISPAKNHRFMIDVLCEVLKTEPDVRLLLVGDGPLRGATEEYIREKGAGDHVIMTGRRHDVPELLSAIDIFLIPSIHEGVGISAIEAQASGLVTLASDTIPPEVKASRLLEFLPIDRGAKIWADAIAGKRTSLVREDMKAELSASGYDIVRCMKQIEEFLIS